MILKSDTIKGIKELRERFKNYDEKLKTKSYLNEIIESAIKTPYYYNTLRCMGIDPKIDFDEKKCIAMLLNLEKDGLAFIYDSKWNLGDIDYDTGIRYLVCDLLNRQEEDILRDIESNIKENPEKLLEKLKALKQSSNYNKYVLDKLIAQAEVWQVMETIPKLKGFPFKDIWHFVLDIEFQKYGSFIFEGSEPGYMTASLKALCFALKLKKPTHIDYVEINRKCGENVMDGMGHGYLKTEIRDESCNVSFGIYGFPEMLDAEGRQDLEARNKDPESPLVRFGQDNRVHLEAAPQERHLGEMQFLFEQHDKKISTAKNAEERLIIYTWLTRELSLRHYFNDGNLRASLFLWLSLIAHDSELPMVLLDTNPNLGMQGPVAYLKRVFAGMKYFNTKCGRPEMGLSFEKFDAITGISGPEKRYWNYYHPTKEAWSAFYAQHKDEEFKTQLAELKKSVVCEKPFWDYDYHEDEMAKEKAKAKEKEKEKEKIFALLSNPYFMITVFALLASIYLLISFAFNRD